MQGSPAALREVFKSPELCALACKECHPYGRGSVNNWWMRYKIGVYGLERVKAALERVNKHLTDPVTLAEFNVSEKERAAPPALFFSPCPHLRCARAQGG